MCDATEEVRFRRVHRPNTDRILCCGKGEQGSFLVPGASKWINVFAFFLEALVWTLDTT